MPTRPAAVGSTLRGGGGGKGQSQKRFSNFLFLAPLCHLAAELFKCRLIRRRQLSGGGGGGGKGQSRKRFSNFFSFLQEASLG